MINYLSSSFIYTKIANLILWFYADYRMGLIYGVIFICNYIHNAILICILFFVCYFSDSDFIAGTNVFRAG